MSALLSAEEALARVLSLMTPTGIESVPLAEASGPVALNHPHCSKFCVLGGASCSA